MRWMVDRGGLGWFQKHRACDRRVFFYSMRGFSKINGVTGLVNGVFVALI